MGLWKVPDKIPEQADAIFIHSYCLIQDGSRLNAMSASCLKKGIQLFLEGRAPYIIIPCAYEQTWRAEERMKRKMITEAGINAEAIKVIPAITSTYGEVAGTADIMDKIGGKSLIVVADQHHMRRSLQSFHRMLPEITIYHASVACPKYEVAMEPSTIKSIRAGYAPFWIAWNIVFYFLGPLLAFKKKA